MAPEFGVKVVLAYRNTCKSGDRGRRVPRHGCQRPGLTARMKALNLPTTRAEAQTAPNARTKTWMRSLLRATCISLPESNAER